MTDRCADRAVEAGADAMTGRISLQSLCSVCLAVSRRGWGEWIQKLQVNALDPSPPPSPWEKREIACSVCGWSLLPR